MKQPAGQSLIESLVAVTIVVVGIVSLVGLLISSRLQSNITQNEALAVELGSEALEAARFVRDSNWLEIEDGNTQVNYYDGLRDGTTYNGIYRWNRPIADPEQAIIFHFITGSAGIDTDDAIVYQDADGFYRQIPGTPPATWTPTQFRRWVTTYPICYMRGATPFGYSDYFIENDGDACAAGEVEVGIQVVVRMQWELKGDTHDRYFEERLYNWKYAEPLN